MSIQETKQYIHHLVDDTDDEVALEAVYRLLSGPDLTDEQVILIKEAQEEARQGKGIPLAEVKLRLDKKLAALKLKALSNAQATDGVNK